MPVQRTLFGQPIRLRIPPRRFQVLFGLLLFVIVSLGFYGPSSSAELYEEVADAVKNPHIPTVPNLHDLPNLPSLPDLPKVPNPFGPAPHKPPEQPNTSSSSPYRAIKWFNDFKWRKAFSLSVTFDENIAVLPPLKVRPPIYTFYDVKGKQDKSVSEAESRLILAWRRAWWAQGFQPIVLSRKEAMEHPQYDFVHRMKLDPKVELEFMRWLAWGRMKGGVLANWLALPMAKYDNPMLSFLRRKEYPVLSRISTLQHGIFFGETDAIEKAIKKAVADDLFKNVTANEAKIAELGKKEGGAFVNLLTKEDIAEDEKANGIAYYSIDTITKTYTDVANKLSNETTQVEGLDMLATLINSHLQLTFQETFSDGVAILKPLPEHTSALMTEAIEIARNLTQCPASPFASSCPPNRQKCKPCDPTKPPKLEYLSSFKNTSTLFSLGTVPHPYTVNLLHYTRDSLDEDFLRRSASRDLWLGATTQALFSDEHTSEDWVIHFKEIVASPQTAANTLWLTAERESQVDLDWIFGFNLPQIAAPGEAATSLKDNPDIKIFPRPPEPKPLEGVKIPEEQYLKNEHERLKKAREALKSKDRRMQEIVKMVENWNLADTEAWRFARSWSGRRREERRAWEDEEKRNAGSESKSGLGGGGRWID